MNFVMADINVIADINVNLSLSLAYTNKLDRDWTQKVKTFPPLLNGFHYLRE